MNFVQLMEDLIIGLTSVPICNIFTNRIGLSIVDALDTLHIMGLQEEFKKARDWVATSFDLARVGL